MMSLSTIRHLNVLHDKSNRCDLFDGCLADLESYNVHDGGIEVWTFDGGIDVVSNFEPQHYHVHYHPAGDDTAGIGVCGDYDTVFDILNGISQCQLYDGDGVFELASLKESISAGSVLYGDPVFLTPAGTYTGIDDREERIEQLAPAPVIAFQNITGDTDIDPVIGLLSLFAIVDNIDGDGDGDRAPEDFYNWLKSLSE